MPEADFRKIIRNHGRRLQAAQGAYCVIQGYDADPRELWEIPEVMNLFARVIDSGLIGLLVMKKRPRSGALGAGDIYAAVNGIPRDSTQSSGWDYSEKDLAAFLDCLRTANATVEEVIIGGGMN
jgi:hypothetical protein